MPENRHSRREVLKMAAVAAISISTDAYTLDAAPSHSPEVGDSPSKKSVYDLSKLPWILSGCAPDFSKFAETTDIRKLDSAEVGPIAAPVPGSVQMALLNAGTIKDWNLGLNARENEWVENRDWIYQVAIPDEWIRDGKEFRLHCAGLDYAGEISLNGKTVRSFEGSFTPHVVELKPLLKPSENLLSIRFTPPPRWLGQAGYTSRMKEWKPRFSYYWDWTSRMVQTGIWDAVRLEVVRSAEIEQLSCIADADVASGKGMLNLSGSVNGGAIVRVTLKSDQQVIRTVDLSAAQFSKSGVKWAELATELWWPNGMGKRPLYELTCELLDDQRRLMDRQSRRIGFRHVEWRRTKGAPESADPYLCVVNGKETFLFGVDWTPIRPNFADLREEDYRQRLGVYRDCGCAHAALGAVEQNDPGRSALLGRRRMRDHRLASRRHERFGRLVARQQAAHPGHEFGRMERFDQIVVRPAAKGLAARVRLVLGQEQDGRSVRGRAVIHPKAGDHSEPVDACQVGRHQHQCRPLGSRQAERIRSLAGYDDFESNLRERVAQRSLYGRIGIDHQDLDGHCYT